MTDEHARIEELLSAVQDGAATPEEAAQVRAHLATCARCRGTAAAYAQIDRQVRRYLMATPVPEMAAPWRNEPLVTVAPRGRGALGHWRATAAGLALIFVMLFAGTVLTFMNRPATQETGQTAGSAAFAIGTATRDSAAVLAAPASAIATAPPPAAAAGAASSASSARAAASAAPASAASSSAPRAAAASAVAAASMPAASAAAVAGAPAPSARPSAAASARPSSAAASAAGSRAPTVSTPTATDQAAINPVQAFQLNTATGLVVCRPACEEGGQSPEVLRAVVVALDRPLPAAPPLPTSTVPYTVVTLRFTLPEGRQIAIDFSPEPGVLALPEGRGLVALSPESVAALAALVPPR